MKILNKFISIVEDALKAILSTRDKCTDVQIKNIDFTYSEDKFNILKKGKFSTARISISAVAGEYPFQVVDDYVIELHNYDYHILQKNNEIYEFGQNGIKKEDIHPLATEDYIKVIADGIKMHFGTNEAMDYLKYLKK